MRDFVKKVGSLVLGGGALSLLLVNAALTHGCGGSRRDAPATQSGAPPPATGERPLGAAQPSSAAQPPSPAPSPTAASTTASAVEEDCEEAPYMHATKAPVIPMRRCGKSTPNAKQRAEPASPANNAQQQAP